jgi:hypothetical protein
MATFLRVLTVAYALCCVVALWFIPASANGWLGIERDPLAGVFALLFALPWTLLLRLMGDTGPWLAVAVLAAGMAVNVWLLWRLQRWWQRRRARGTGP